MPLHMKKNLLLGHGWHLTGNSLKWLTISYPVIWCDSPLNSTLNRCTFPIYIHNHSTFSFHQHDSSEGQVITIRHAVKGSVLGNHKHLCPLYLHEPISPPRQGSACSPSHSRAAITGGSSGKLSRFLPHRMLFPRSFPFLRVWSEAPDMFLRPFSSSLWGSKQEYFQKEETHYHLVAYGISLQR